MSVLNNMHHTSCIVNKKYKKIQKYKIFVFKQKNLSLQGHISKFLE